MEKANIFNENDPERMKRYEQLKKDKVFDIRGRTFNFSQRMLKIVEMLPSNNIGKNFQNQLLKSGTAVGANMEEADGSITKPDFINKVALARKEAKETRYWLRLISKKYNTIKNIQDDIKESEEIIRILSAIIVNTKHKTKE